MTVITEAGQISETENVLPNKGPRIGTRHIQILLLALGMFTTFSTRTSFSVQIVAMTSTNSSSNPDIASYDWSNRNIILSSFFWTYTIVNPIAGPLENRFGVKWIFLGAIFINVTAFTLIPLIASICGSIGVLICRLAQGFGQGFLFPTQQGIIGIWAPADERARAGMTAIVGMALAAILSQGLSGYLCSTWWGWPSSFYVFGILGYAWCFFYLIFGQNSPESHPRITPEEKRYILTSLNKQENVKVPIPWKRIITSLPVAANLVAHIGVTWTMNLYITELATYLDKIMNFDITSNGLYSGLSGLFALIGGCIYGPLSDYLINHEVLSTGNARKLFHFIGGFGVGTCLIFLSFLNASHKNFCVAIMMLTGLSQVSLAYGNGVNMVDISPKFAAVIYGLLNAIAQAIAIFAPIMVQYVVPDLTNVVQWRIVFLLTAAVILGTTGVFLAFSSGERQPWDGESIKTTRRRHSSIASFAETIGAPQI